MHTWFLYYWTGVVGMEGSFQISKHFETVAEALAYVETTKPYKGKFWLQRISL